MLRAGPTAIPQVSCDGLGSPIRNKTTRRLSQAPLERRIDLGKRDALKNIVERRVLLPHPLCVLFPPEPQQPAHTQRRRAVN